MLKTGARHNFALSVRLRSSFNSYSSRLSIRVGASNRKSCKLYFSIGKERASQSFSPYSRTIRHDVFTKGMASLLLARFASNFKCGGTARSVH